MSFRYDAFISYRHAPLDMDIAKRVHRGLETFKVPRAVQKTSGKKKINRVFRDQEELPIGSDLTDNIDKALDESEFLIVVCSPRTPGSEWVQKEIESFIAKHGRSHALAILIEGEPNESFPKALLEDENGNPVEPLAADVRGETDAERRKKLKTELMRLAAPLLGCAYDDLRQRHRERKLRKAIGTAAGIGSVVALLGIAFGIYNARNAEIIRQSLLAKQENQSKYLANEAMSLLEQGDRRAAALVAAEGLPRGDGRPFVPSAAYALAGALHVYDTGSFASFDRNLLHDSVVSSFKFNQAGDMITTIDAGGSTYLWRTDDGRLMAKIPPTVSDSGYYDNPLDAVAFDDNLYVVDKLRIYAYDYEGSLQWKVDMPDEFSYAKIDEQSGQIVCTRYDKVVIYSCEDGRKVQTYENTDVDGFSNPQVYNIERSKLLVAKIQEIYSEETTVPVSVLDLDTGKSTDIEIENTYIVEAAWTADGNIAVVSCDFDSMFENRDVQMRLDVVNMSGEVLWSYEFEHKTDYYVRLKARAYSDDTGAHNDLIMASTDMVYVFDAKTGAVNTSIFVDGGVEDMLVSAKSEYIYVSKTLGGIDITSSYWGGTSEPTTIETEGRANKFLISNGVVAFSRYQSDGLQLMKYQASNTMEVLGDYIDDPTAIYTSDDESYYAVCYGYGQSRTFEFYDCDNNYVWNSIDVDGEWVEDCRFVDDKTFVILLHDGAYYSLDVKSQQSKKTDMRFNDSALVETSLSRNGRYATIKTHHDIQVWDVLKEKVLYELRDIDELVDYVRVSPTGEYLMVNLHDTGMHISHNGGKLQKLDENARASAANKNSVVTFSDTKAAVVCTDNILRVYDMDSKKCLNEIYYVGQDRGFVGFFDEGKKLIVQGDNHRLSIYSLEDDELLFYSSDVYYEFKDYKIDEKTGIISLASGYELLLIDKNTCQPLAEIENGMAYIAEQKSILASKWNTGYKFKYLEASELLEELENQFAGEKLSDIERISYNID